jgi:hypothetical protein
VLCAECCVLLCAVCCVCCVCCVLCAVCCVLRAACCVFCAVCAVCCVLCVLCAVCCGLRAACCVLCAVCAVCGVCCELRAVSWRAMCVVVRVPLYANNEHRAGDAIDNWLIKGDQQHSLAVGLLRKPAEGPLNAVPVNGNSSAFTFTEKPGSSATGTGSEVYSVSFAESS